LSAWLLDRPLAVGPQELPGRVFVAAHQPGLADDGLVGPRYIAYQRARARAGAAMQITGAMPVAPSEVWAGFALTAARDAAVEGFKRLADAVRGEGGRMLGQLAHAGPTELGGADVLGPSRIVSEVSRQVVRPTSDADLDRMLEQFAAAAARCARGELDGVEVSLAHGLLLAAFVSPFTNRREDGLGGTVAQRLAYPLRVVDAVRDAVGAERIVGVRLAGDELVDGGLTPATIGEVASALEPHADYLNVTIGNNNALEARVRHWAPTPSDSRLFRAAARAVKAVVSVPVAMAGRVVDLDEANAIVAAGDADLVGMVRAHIADPELLSKARAGRRAEIRPCVGANVCVDRSLTDKPIACLHNPDVAAPGEPARTLAGRTAVVVGGGPAGLEAARRLARRGAAVILHERDRRLGGQMADWALAPSRREVARALAWWERELERLGVDVRLGSPADPSLTGDDLVVVATGAAAAPLEAVEHDDSVDTVDVRSALRTGVGDRRAVVYDALGDLDAMLVCERLVALGARDVALATGRVHAGEGAGITTLFPMLRTLAELGVELIERVRLRSIGGGRLALEGVFGGAPRWVEADVVVPWLGGVSRTELVDELRAGGREPILVGDALRPRRVEDAVAEAARAVDSL
jgi:2,4-dienoyl-CoA reductase-like NADH-dependent reductase (Old Yellow Enzyme family)